MKLTLEVAEEQPKCGARPSPRSTARCEMPPEHWRKATLMADIHSGRTRGGYWKFWQVSEEEAKGDS